MLKNVIKIGKEYESAFDSVCELLNRGLAKNEDIRLVNKNTIEYKGSLFELTSWSLEDESTQEVDINSEGATWFKSLREGTKQEGSSSDWLNLVNDVAEEYHKTNSFFEFKQMETMIPKEKKAQYKNNIRSFMARFYPNVEYDQKRLDAKEDDSAYVDVYIINFLMDINIGVGKTRKVLGRVYFKSFNKKYVLLNAYEAEEIQKQIDTVMENNEYSDDAIVGHNEDNDKKIINDMLARLENEINNNKDFSDSIILSSAKDEKIISEFLKKASQFDFQLNCDHMRAFGIYHARWGNYYTQVENGEKPLLNVLINTSDKMTVICDHCSYLDNGILMVDNGITYQNEDGKTIYVTLDFAKKDLGISQEVYDDIMKHSNISKHLIPIKCQGVDPRNKNISCSKSICEQDAIECDGKLFCRDCKYPKIIFIDDNGVAHITRNTVFASDAHTLVDREKARVCAVCGRSFTNMGESKTCELCTKLVSGRNNERDNVYGKYKFLFPVNTRMLVNKEKSYALEDPEVVLFSLSRNNKVSYYKFDKLDFKEKGYVNSPVKLKVSRYIK